MEALRVVDSSIFPRITNGNLNGPSMMVGEKAADLILGREPLRLQPRAVDQPELGDQPAVGLTTG
jgi:choline dehydrogenase